MRRGLIEREDSDAGVGRAFADEAEGEDVVCDIVDGISFGVETWGHGGLAGEDQAAPIGAKLCLADTDVLREETVIEFPGIQQHGPGMWAVGYGGCGAGEDSAHIGFGDGLDLHIRIGDDYYLILRLRTAAP